ncbi:MAG: sugar ABC transporter substrate-binding protein [Chloroflexota bacterium]
MSKKSLFVVLLIGLMALVVAPTAAQDKTVVNWFVGLGTGTQPNQIDVQNKVVADFNASQSAIELKINIAASNQVAPDALSTLIAAGTAPDIIGPVGFDGSNQFAGQWLDLQPYVDKTKYDLGQFPDNLVNLYQAGDQGLLGIPFAVYPGMIFVNKDLFDEAGLAYPPAKFGDKYMLDGKEVDWSWDTLATIAKTLTVDANGNDATSADFDATKIVQFGFNHQWGTQRADFSTFGGSPVIDATSGKVLIPDNWRAEAQWVYDGIWKDHFIPTATYDASDLLKPSAFASGKVAMSRTPFWYTCCLGDLKANWDLAVTPSYNGTYYAPADADTFRIYKGTKNPDAAFTVLQYLLGEGAGDLLAAYGAYPARPDLQAAAIDKQKAAYPSVKNWDAVAPSLEYATVPHHESYYPNYAKGQQRFNDFRTLMYGDTGKDMDVKAELDKLQSDLQAIVDAAPK